MSAPSTDLPGVADLTGRLAERCQIPAAVMVISSVDVNGSPVVDGSAVTWMRDCRALAGVTVHPAFLGEDPAVMAGVLAHELAHHREVVEEETLLDRAAWPLLAFVAGATVPALAGVHLGLMAAQVVVTAAVWGARRLWQMRGERREELAADAYSVLLLDACGLPGRECAGAALERAGGGEPWWDRWLWWMHTHPTTAQRLAALDRR